MSSFSYFASACLTVAVALWAAGCNNAPPAGTTTAEKEGEHGHDHGETGHDHAGHDHDHEGLHGGHLLEPDTEGYHFEWAHTDDGKVTVYVLDGTAKKDLPIAASEITIETTIGKDTRTFKLAAVGASEADMKSAKFEIVDLALLGLLEALKPDNESVTATVIANIEGLEKPVTAKIEGHSHEHKH